MMVPVILRGGLPATLACLVTALLLPSAAPGAAIPHFGVNGADAISFARVAPPQFFADLGAMGGNTLRQPTDWSTIEPREGEWSWSSLDQIVDSTPRDTKLIFAVIGSPSWARDLLENLLFCRAAPQCPSPPAVAHLADWQVFVVRLCLRYQGRIAAIEVWNEPNLQGFWQGFPDPGEWGNLIKATAQAAGAVDTGIPVISGGLVTGSPADDPAISEAQADYLAEAYQAVPSLPRHVDGLGVHLYTGGKPPDDADTGIDASLSAMGAVRNRYDRGKRFWVTEVGYLTMGVAGVSEDEQADWLSQIYDQLSARADVEAMIIHALYDRSWVPSETEISFGLIRADGTPKPAYCSFVLRFAGTRAGC
jgi:hypothetical protein